ncbi:uncharacterized protein LOC126689600 [Quercus robur]|uniref:uncharacterized protein LOC126689600 n=1 Tax=Quercus robur TaxID=38942 RepID=UPI0021636F21|nr:uncharacterized protein LOC126689600 [Quercus robur]
MPFRLKNTGATYQRLMNKMFAHQIYRNVQVYVNDMLVKSLREDNHLDNLKETFDTLRSFNMKLNPNKCAFGVTMGKFLGFMVSQRGIEVNPENVRAIMELEPLRTVKEVQSLNGKITALNRFVSRATDRCLPFFRTLRKSFEWTDECQTAFDNLKTYLSFPLLLSPSKPGKELYLYLAISQAVVSAALVREEDGSLKPVCFTSRTLRGVEEKYPQMEKLAFTLIIAARKLKPYFQAHTIIVLMDKPLRKAMSSLEVVEKMALWAVELSEFDIQYRLRMAINGQIVADFITEFTFRDGQGAEEKRQWSIYTKGSSNRRAEGAGMVIQTPEGDKICCMIRLDFPTTNNEAEYEALVAGLDLAKAAASSLIDDGMNMKVVDTECNWTTPLMSYLRTGMLPVEKDAARKLKKPLRSTIVSTQDDPNRILLAHNAEGRVSLCKVLRQMSKVQQFHQTTIRRANPHDNTLAIHSMEARYRGPIPDNEKATKVFGSWYGIPRVLVSDNGRQFDNNAFRDFCLELGIKNHYLSPTHPQTNGQVEITNRSLLKIIKTRLERAKDVWLNELLSVLWAYWTTARTPIGEIGLTSYRVENYDKDKNEEAMRLQLDLVDEVRAVAEQRLARYQNLMEKHYNSNVRHRDFQVGDLVLRKVMGATRDPSQGKLGPN